MALGDTESAAERIVAGHRDPLNPTYAFQQFSVLPLVALEAGLTALVQKRLAEKLANYLPIELVRAPGPMTKIELRAMWSVARQEDQAHRWFLELLKQICRAESHNSKHGN